MSGDSMIANIIAKIKSLCNNDIYSLVTYVLLFKIFSAKLLLIFKNRIRISMVYLTCASIFEKLSSPSNHTTPQNQLGRLGGTLPF
jgi:hypothetical protein